MQVIGAALSGLMEDVVPLYVDPVRYDRCDHCDHCGPRDGMGLSLAPDGGILEHPEERIVPVLSTHTPEELERGARLLLLRAARRVHPDDVRMYFAYRDLIPEHILEIPEMLVGGGMDIERGDALLVLAEPNLTGLLVRQGDLTSVIVFNPAGVIRVDPLAERLPPPLLFPQVPQALRQANLRIARRARALLFTYLVREQKWELRAHRRLTVTGQDGATYRIYAWQGMNVRLVEGNIETCSLCIVPDSEVTTLPVYDLMLAQKVLLETNITKFKEIAIRHRV